MAGEEEKEEKSITEQAWDLIGELDDGMSRDERDAKFRVAGDRTLERATPNIPYQEAHVATFSPLHEEIHRLWTEDVENFPPK